MYNPQLSINKVQDNFTTYEHYWKIQHCPQTSNQPQEDGINPTTSCNMQEPLSCQHLPFIKKE